MKLGRALDAADLRADGNAFTMLRWLLASLVMVSHGWDLTQYRTGLDPTIPVLGVPVAALAVFGFFSLSGFLVTGSLAKRGLRDFAAARLLRVVPGLWVMLLVTTFGLWAVFGTLPLGEYLGRVETRDYLWRNAALIGGWYTLPGIFADNPFPTANGSLWTIPLEVRCYIVLALLGAAGALLRPRLLTGLLLAGAVVHVAVPLDAWPALDQPRRLGFAFFLGVLAWLWRDRLQVSWPLAVIAGMAALALVRAEGIPEALRIAGLQIGFAYLILVAAVRAPAAIKTASARLPDYSYGIYIYAFPAQEAAYALGLGTTPLTNIAAGFALALPFAALSWHLIERPALRLKPSRRLVGKPYTYGR